MLQVKSRRGEYRVRTARWTPGDLPSHAPSPIHICLSQMPHALQLVGWRELATVCVRMLTCPSLDDTPTNDLVDTFHACWPQTGCTALHQAVTAGSLEVVRLLLGREGADVNAMNKVHRWIGNTCEGQLEARSSPSCWLHASPMFNLPACRHSRAVLIHTVAARALLTF